VVFTAGREGKREGSRSRPPYYLKFLAAAREPTVQLLRNLPQHCMQFRKFPNTVMDFLRVYFVIFELFNFFELFNEFF